MIVFDHVTQPRRNPSLGADLLSVASAIVPSDRRIALLGSLEEKRLMVDLITGMAAPKSGRILRKARISFPAGDTRFFANDVTVLRNVEYIARLYSLEVQDVVGFVSKIPEVKGLLNKKFSAVPPIVRKQFSQIMAYCVPFDTYVLTDIVTRGSPALQSVSDRFFEARAQTAGVIVPTRDERFVRRFCDMAIVLLAGEVVVLDDLDQALLVGRELARTARVIS